MPTPDWPTDADSAVADIRRLRAGRYVPTPTGAAAGLSWPDYADSPVAGICRSV